MQGPGGVRRGSALSDTGTISDGSVLIKDGRIFSVGTTRRLENMKEARNALEVPVHGKVVLPGFIDAGLNVNLQRPGEGQRLRRTTEFFDDSVGLMRACLQHGTVTAKVHANAGKGDPHSDVTVLRKLEKIGDQLIHIVKSWCVEFHAPAPENAGPPNLRPILETLLKRGFIDGVSVAINPLHEPDPHSIEILRSTGLRLDLIWSGGPLTSLRQSLERIVPHVVCLTAPLTQAEAALLASQKTIALLPAGKHLLEGSGDPAAVRTFIEQGGALALSSGYHSAAAPNFNMQMAIALAVVRLGLKPAEAITAATINAAHAIGQETMTGSLEVGKQADVVVLNIGDIRDLPQQFGVNHVAMVFRGGNIVLNRTRWRLSSEASAHRVRTKSF